MHYKVWVCQQDAVEGIDVMVITFIRVEGILVILEEEYHLLIVVETHWEIDVAWHYVSRFLFDEQLPLAIKQLELPCFHEPLNE